MEVLVSRMTEGTFKEHAPPGNWKKAGAESEIKIEGGTKILTYIFAYLKLSILAVTHLSILCAQQTL